MSNYLPSRISAVLNYQSGGLLLLLVYVFIFIVPPGIVPHSEHEHEEHGVNIENDPCHISIYHPGLDGGCKHKYHFTQNCPDCERSHLTLVRQHIIQPVIWSDIHVLYKIQHTHFSDAPFYPSLPDHHDRGPPCTC